MRPFCLLLPSVAVLALFVAGNALAFDSQDTPYHILAGDSNRMDPDRVSLWPLAYHDSKATSIIWPLFSVSDDYLSAGLFYSQRGGRSVNEFSLLWPFCQINLKEDTGWVLPFVWSDDSFALFPLLWHGRKYDVLFPLCGVKHNDFRTTYWGALGLACCRTSNSRISDAWLFPLFYTDFRSFLSLPYYHTNPGTVTHEGLCCGLVGWERHQGSLDALWTFPLFYYSEGHFLSLLYAQTPKVWTAGCFLAGATQDERWILPCYLETKNWRHTPLASWSADHNTFFSLPLLSWMTDGNPTFLAGLAGWRPDYSWVAPLYYHDECHFFSLLGGYTPDASWVAPLYYHDECHFFSLLGGYTPDASWIAPLYYRDKDLFLTLPFATWRTGWTAGLGLAGAAEDASWCFPLYYADNDDFFSPFFCRHDDAEDHTSQITIPWLLGEYDSAADGSVSNWKFLLGLAGGKTDAKGRSSHWLFPLYLARGYGFGTLLFGHFSDEQSSSTWLATPLVGYHYGSSFGSQVIPIYSYSRDCGFDDAERLMEATTLVDADFETISVTNKAKQVQCVTRVRTGKRLTSNFYTPIGKRTRVLCDRAEGCQRERYHRTDARHWNSFFLWKSTDSREVHFDVKTKRKTGERHTVSHNSLFFLYDHEETENTIHNTYTSDSSILWRLWRRHEKNGNVSMDVFPGFSRDTRTDGYSKTSFLWKFFNYESDPKKGDKLDLFFIPIF